MFWRRLFYAVLTAAAVVSFIISDSGIALFISVSLLVIPVASFLMLVFAAKRFVFGFESAESCIRGGSLRLKMTAGLKPRFIVGTVKVVAQFENTTFRKTLKKTFKFADLSASEYFYDYTGADSGRICVTFPKIYLIDLFGICSVKVRNREFAEAIVSPVLYDDIQARLVNSAACLSGENPLPQKGNDHAEIFNVRDYAAGDPLNSVHWKLTGKFDSLKSKEYGATDDNHTLILVDLSRKKGAEAVSDGMLNRVLDTAVSVSGALKSHGSAHRIGWFNDGVFACADVYDNDSFVAAVYSLMSIKTDEGNSESLFYFSRTAECSSYTKIIFVAAGVYAEELKHVPAVDLTAVSVGEKTGEVSEGNARIIYVPFDGTEKTLTACVL